MNQRILLVGVFILLLTAVLPAQDWMHRYDGNASQLDESADVALLNGRTYVAGSSFGPATGWDIYVAVLDGSGNELFTRTIAVPGDQKAVKILPVDNDRFTVVGHGASSTGPGEVIVHRFSNEGAMLQTSNIGLTPGTWLSTVKDAIRISSTGVAILVDGANNEGRQQSVVVAVVDGQVAWGNPYPVSGDAWGTKLLLAGPVITAAGYYGSTGTDAFFVGYDGQGNTVFDVPIDTGGDDYIADVDADAQFNYYFCGWTEFNGQSTPFAAKADDQGTLVYQINLSNPGPAGARAVDLVLTGNGEAAYLVRDNDGSGFATRTVKLDTDGNIQWDKGEPATPAATNEAPLFAGLSAVVTEGSDARLYWMPALDDQLYTDEIVYNIYVSESSGGHDFSNPTATVRNKHWYRYTGMEAGKTYYFVVRASDGTNEDANTRERSGMMVTTLHITTTGLPDAERGTAYSHQFTADAGLEPYTWTITAGALPSGMALDATGLLSGTSDDTADDYTFTVQVEDANMVTDEKQFTLTLASQPLMIETAFLPNGEPNVYYDEPLIASGGTPPYTWTQVSGTLPDGLSLLPTGQLRGAPTTIGTYDFRLRVTDAVSAVAERDYTVEIAITDDLVVDKDTALLTGTYKFRNIRVDAGFTLLLDGAVTLEATDSVSVAGTIWSPCHDLLISGPVMLVTGDIMDTCAAPGDNPGSLTLHATDFMMLGDSTKSPDGTDIAADGDITITDRLGVTKDEYIVTPGMRSSSPMDPVGTLTADILNARTSATDPVIVEFILRGADPDGGPVTFDMDFGDGNTETGILPADGEIAFVEHPYTTTGEFAAMLTIRDNEGATATTSAKVFIYDESATDAYGLGLAIEPTSMLIDVEDSVAFIPEIGLNIDGGIASYNWNFGDGNMSTEEDPAHLYAAPGRYEVSVDVVDDSGNTASASGIVYVFEPDSTQAVQGGGFSKAAATGPRLILAARVRGKNFSGYSNQWLWVAGWITARGGSDADSARSGKSGGYTNLRVNGPLNIGPLPGGFGLPPLIGGGNGGNGGGGRNGMGRSSSRGGKGGNGGSVRITAKNLNVSGGVFSTGSGGNGGDATLNCSDGKNASAYGGTGGKPGSTLRLIGTQSCSFSGNVSFVLGVGGKGGNATATACNGENACPQGEDGGNAIARGGRGNGSPKKAMVLGRPTGLNSITVSGGDGGRGGNATATAGNGGNAVCDNVAIGGKGGRSSATAGDGGKSGLRSTRRAMAMNVAPGSFKGGDGGDAVSTGGNGGIATANPSPAKSMGCSAKGVDTEARGGDGNRAYGRNGDYGRSRVNGANNDGNPGSVTLAGSDGGNATSTGGDGGDGDSCCPGGDGGKADSEAGERGERVARSVHGGAVTNPDPKQGDATATGGNGGMAGDCCNPPSQGQDGGSGGPAIANALDPNGVYTAKGGNGGNGGDGKPAGGGGGGGAASGSQTGNATNGNPGGPGNLCKIQSTGCFHWDLPLGPISPGTYQVPLYRNGVVDPANLFGYLTLNINGNVFNEGAGLLLQAGAQIGIDATSLTGGNPAVSWPTWYPIEVNVQCVPQGSSPTAQVSIGGGFNAQPIDNDAGNGNGSPFTLSISAVGSTEGKFDFVGLQSTGDFFLPDMGFCIKFEDP